MPDPVAARGPEHDDTTVERVAEAIYVANGFGGTPWTKTGDAWRNQYRVMARAALATTAAQGENPYAAQRRHPPPGARESLLFLRQLLRATLDHCTKWHGTCCPCDAGDDDFCVSDAEEALDHIEGRRASGDHPAEPERRRRQIDAAVLADNWGPAERPTDEEETS